MMVQDTPYRKKMKKFSSQQTIAIIAVAVAVAGAAITLCLYGEHFLLLKKNTIFLYTWDFLHQHIALPVMEEWKWTGVFAVGGLVRYINAFLAQFYTNIWIVEAVQIPLIALWVWLWCRILGVPPLRGVGLSPVSFCFRKKDAGSIPNAAIRAAYTSVVILTAAAAYLYIAISPTFPLGATTGALLSVIQLYHFRKTKKAYSKTINVIAGTLVLYYFAGIPSALIYFVGVLVVTTARVIAPFLHSRIQTSSYRTPASLATNIYIIIILLLTATIPYFAAEPLFLQSSQAAYDKDFFKQFKEKSTNNLYHTNEKTEYALYKNNYTKALELCSKAYKKAERPKTPQQLYSLYELAHYTKTALLFNRELCDKFLQYYNAPAMQWLFPVQFSNKAMADLFFRLGESGYAKHAAINEMEEHGQSAYIAKILDSEATEKGLQTAVDATSPPDIVILQLPQDQGSPVVRDAKAMIYLLFKQTDSAAAQFSDVPNLPQYIQEALLINHNYGQNPRAPQELQKYAISNETIKKYEQFLQALQSYQYGQASRQQIVTHFAGTYACYYYFQTAEYQR
jgi:hypothetical protein